MARITELKVVEVDQNVCKNPFYVTWRNSLGGFEYWLFEWRQDEGHIIGNVKQSSKYIEDLDTATSKGETLSLDVARKVKLFAENLNTDRLQGLATIRESEYILHWNGTIWQRITVEPGSFFNHRNDAEKHKIEFEITFDKKF